MKKIPKSLLAILLTVSLMSACSTDPGTAPAWALTHEEVEGKYKDIEHNLYYYSQKQYILVEFNEGMANQQYTSYDLINCQTGDVDRIRPNGVAELLRFDDHEVALICFDHIENPYFQVPKQCIFRRNSENPNNDDDFILVDQKNMELSLQDETSVMGKPGVLADIVITFNSIQLLFKPLQGQEDVFYAGQSTSPSATFKSGVDDMELVYEFNGEIKNEIITEDWESLLKKNEHLEHIEFRSLDGGITKVIISFTEPVFYSVTQEYTDSNNPFITILLEALLIEG